MAETKRQTKIVDGVEVTINPDVLMDWDVVMKLIDVMETPDDAENMSLTQTAKKIRAIESVTDRIFGSEQFERIKDELRKRYDGLLPIEPMLQFISDVFDVYMAKN